MSDYKNTAWYARQLEKQRKTMPLRKQAIREYIQSKKTECVRCGYSKNPAALQFHHIDPTSKEIGPSKMVANCWATERIDAELAKCEVLCANCHFEHHHPTMNR